MGGEGIKHRKLRDVVTTQTWLRCAQNVRLVIPSARFTKKKVSSSGNCVSDRAKAKTAQQKCGYFLANNATQRRRCRKFSALDARFPRTQWYSSYLSPHFCYFSQAKLASKEPKSCLSLCDKCKLLRARNDYYKALKKHAQTLLRNGASKADIWKVIHRALEAASPTPNARIDE